MKNMLTLSSQVNPVFYSELLLFLLSANLLYIELKSMKTVLSHKTTIFLVSFLVSLTLLFTMRTIGVYSGNLVIRTYFSALLGLFCAVFFISWGSLAIKMSNRVQKLYLGGLFFGMFSFVLGRLTKIETIEVLGIVTITIVLTVFMVTIFFYIFKKSPYIRARQRLFVLTIAFIAFAVVEGMAVTAMGTENYHLASLLFLLQIPSRIGITLSIVLPKKLTKLLTFIN